jgi:alpha-beta hydrolase superfamily lysophospholipase
MNNPNMVLIIFIHGLESSGTGFKSRFFKTIFPDIVTPDFYAYNPNISLKKILSERMRELYEILKTRKPWIIIGSSFGGLMAAYYALQFPRHVNLLILLAPFIDNKLIDLVKYDPVEVPTIMFQGKNDTVVSFLKSYDTLKSKFRNLETYLVDDNHFLHKLITQVEWKELIKDYS